MDVLMSMRGDDPHLSKYLLMLLVSNFAACLHKSKLLKCHTTMHCSVFHFLI
ncbi:hypothetical protein FQN60_015295 [Etheostoma spectabile]|uniref:Uncharacterized protein n=1 Tax=Etheostoma spectabile TaxID=54343 RepID=A0A5J5CQR7_9PERO|nr:hypothetical protein FQN60_015295 [Etheostoma spectabile]